MNVWRRKREAEIIHDPPRPDPILDAVFDPETIEYLYKYPGGLTQLLSDVELVSHEIGREAAAERVRGIARIYRDQEQREKSWEDIMARVKS